MTKEELRAHYKQARLELGVNRKKDWDTAVLRRIVASDYFRRAKKVFLYAPTKEEANLLPLVKVAGKQGKTVAFPRCDPETETISFFELAPGEKLYPGAFGIYEPGADAKPCEPDENTLCLVPGLTFDRAGNRLGYGKGYYDRFLATFPGVSAGVVYQDFLSDALPLEDWDRPVHLLFTDRASIGVGRPVKETTKLQLAWEKVKDQSARLWGLVKKEATEPLGQRNFRPVHTPPALVFLAFLLLLLFGAIDLFLKRTWEMVLLVPFQFLVFGIPLGLYFLLGGKNSFSPKRLRLNRVRTSQLWFLTCVLVVMISGSLLSSILTGGISSLDGSFTLYSTFVAKMNGSFWSILYVLLAFAIVPAACEELFFRGVLCPFYEKFGAGVSIFVSGLFFAMIHFSLPLFLTYFFLGMLLAFTLYATGSLYATLALHFLYNLFCLFGQPYLSDFYVNAGNNAVFIFLVTVIFLLFCAFGVGQAQKIYHRYAKEGRPAAHAEPMPLREYPRAIVKVLFTPCTLFCLIVWLVVCLINL